MAPGRHPDNPWSLFGLKAALSAQDLTPKAEEEVAALSARLKRQLDKAGTVAYDGSSDKDFTLSASCACAGRPIVGDAAVASL